MAQVEFLHRLFAHVLEIRRNDRVTLQRVSPEPLGEIRLNCDRARLAHLRDFAIDANDAFSEFHVAGLQAENFTRAEARADACEQAEREERHCRRILRFDELHERLSSIRINVCAPPRRRRMR